MFPILLILFTVLPALEFYFLFKIGSQIGAFNTFGIIILTGIVGAALAKAQGLSILQKIQSEVQRGQMPGKHIVHGFMVFGGGLLLLTPGFLTDALGFSMVIPGTRHIIVVFVSEYLKKGIANGNVVFMSNINGAHFHSGNRYNASPEVQQDVFEAEYREKE